MSDEAEKDQPRVMEPVSTARVVEDLIAHYGQWAKELPTAPGWYWYRNLGDASDCSMSWIGNSAVVVEISEPSGLKVWVTHMDYQDDLTLENFPGEWAGPIDPPA